MNLSVLKKYYFLSAKFSPLLTVLYILVAGYFDVREWFEILYYFDVSLSLTLLAITGFSFIYTLASVATHLFDKKCRQSDTHKILHYALAFLSFFVTTFIIGAMVAIGNTPQGV